MINDFLIINCTGQNNKIGLKINNNFYTHDFSSQIRNNETLVLSILNLTKKYKAIINKDFSVLINRGPGSFSSIRVSLAVAKGIVISKGAMLFGFKNSNLPQFNLANIEVLIAKNLLEKKLIKPLYLS